MLKFGREGLLKIDMPEGIVAIFFIQIVSTLSYSVLFSTLVLYMKGKLGLHANLANSIMGVFIAFNYGLHLLGGFWGGRLMSNRALFCVGMFAQVIGCLLLSISSVNFLYYALAAFLTGSGLNVTCLNCMLTQRFAPQDQRREKAFLWNYAGMNIGFFIGFSLSGLFQMTQDYERLFLLSSLGNLMALLICLFCWQQLGDKNTAYSQKDKISQRKANKLGLLGVFSLAIVLTQMIQYADWANKLVLLTGFCMLVLLIVLAYKQATTEAKNKMLAFAALMSVSAIFQMLYLTAPMGLTLFIDYNVQRAYGSWIFPPQWFQNINTIAIVFGGPLLSILLIRMREKGVKIHIPTQFAFALLFIGLAFAVLPISIYYANAEGLVSPSWIVLSFILQSIGELLISPIGYAMIGSLAPTSLQGVMMGMWMLNTGVGATLSSYSSNLMISNQESTSPLLTNSGYAYVFLMLGLFAMAAAAVLFIFVPKLKELMNEGNTTHQNNEANLIAAE